MHSSESMQASLPMRVQGSNVGASSLSSPSAFNSCHNADGTVSFMLRLLATTSAADFPPGMTETTEGCSKGNWSAATFKSTECAMHLS